MKKIIILLNILSITVTGSSQCLTTEDANNTISSCQFGNGHIGKEDESTSNILTAQAQKWMVNIFNTVMNPAIKKTKGLRGTCSGEVKVTKDDGLFPYKLYSFMQELGCTKSQKLYEKEESGIKIEFVVNTLYSIAKAIEHDEYVWVKKSKEKTTVYDKVNGRQLYLLNQPTVSGQYPDAAFYSRDEAGTKNILIAKDGDPLFIPVSIKDVLLTLKNIYVYLVNEQNNTYADFVNQGVEGFLAQMDLPNFEKSFGKEAAEKAKTDYIKTYNETVAGYKNMKEDNIYKKWVATIDTYLQKSSAVQLAKSCIVEREIFIEEKPITDALFFDNPTDGMQYITINPVYNNKKNPTTPQFVVVQIAINAKSAVSLSGKKDFEDNMDFGKLKSFLQPL